MHVNSVTVAALGVFVFTYVLISFRTIRRLNLDRPSAALLGATLMILTGAVSIGRAYLSVNYDTIFLLLGMMVIIAHLKVAGFFEWVATAILLRARTPRRLLWLLVFASGGLSALFVNDTICLLFTPVLLAAVLRAKLPPLPYLLALASASNIGSVMTLTGNPQNMLVGIFSDIAYGRFFLLLAPIAIVCLALNAWMVERLFAGRLGESFSVEGLVLPPVDRVALRRVGFVLVVVLAGFLLPLHAWLPAVGRGQNLPLAAMAGATLSIFLGRFPPRRAFEHVDWPLLVFFACLFVVVEGVSETGVLASAHEVILPLFGVTPERQASVMTVFSLVLSNVVSNVPFVFVARDWVGATAAPDLTWLVIAMSSTFAGNLTIVGSVANMIVFEQARDAAPIGFRDHFRLGLPLTLATTAVGLGMLLLLHALGAV